MFMFIFFKFGSSVTIVNEVYIYQIYDLFLYIISFTNVSILKINECVLVAFNKKKKK